MSELSRAISSLNETIPTKTSHIVTMAREDLEALGDTHLLQVLQGALSDDSGYEVHIIDCARNILDCRDRILNTIRFRGAWRTGGHLCLRHTRTRLDGRSSRPIQTLNGIAYRNGSHRDLASTGE